MDLTHHPVVLYHASIERMRASQLLFENREYVVATYLGGVAVECIMQALTTRAGEKHDAHHYLPGWLSKCPKAFRDDVKENAAAEWNLLVSRWDNGLRYLSKNGFLGYLRGKGATRGIAGGPEAIIRENTRRIIRAADIIHKKGVSQWMSFIKK